MTNDFVIASGAVETRKITTLPLGRRTQCEALCDSIMHDVLNDNRFSPANDSLTIVSSVDDGK